MQKLFLIWMTCLPLVLAAGPIAAQKEPAKVAKAQKKGALKKASSKKKKAVVSKKQKKKKGSNNKKKLKKKVSGDTPKPAKSGPLPEEATKAVKDLESADPDVVIEAIQILGMTENPEAASPLIGILEQGPRSDITDAILFALSSVRHGDAVPVLLKYLNHRRSDARIAAITALTNYEGDKVTRGLESALADSDRQVRSSAALALGKRGDSRAVPILFLAFERGVSEAAIAIGQLGSVEDSKRLTHYLGKEGIRIMLSGFDEFLKRDDFPEEAKLNILNRLFDLAGPEVWRFAVTYKATFPPDTDENENRIFKLVNRMVRQIKDK